MPSPNPAPVAPAAAPAWRRYATPRGFYAITGRTIPWFVAAATLFAAAGLYIGFALVPAEGGQRELHRIVYLHVPMAWMSLFLYLVTAAWAALGLAWPDRIPSMMALALAPTGAVCALLALWTGAIWGKPTWGTWWAWDARLTAEVLLLVLYGAFLALHAAIEDARRADRASALLAVAGAAGVPAVYYSVQWWSSRQPGGVPPLEVPDASPLMLAGMLLAAAATWMYAFAVSFARVRCVILERERESNWVARGGARTGAAA